MHKELMIVLAIYLCIISVISVIVCIYDKFASKFAKRHRTREAVLLGLSALGGSVAMLGIMLIIRHKTKHLKFMLGIPAIIVVQTVVGILIAILAF